MFIQTGKKWSTITVFFPFYVTWFCFFLLVYGDRAQRGSSFPLFSLIFPSPKNELIRFSRSHVKYLAQCCLNFFLCSCFPSVEMTVFSAIWYNLNFWPLCCHIETLPLQQWGIYKCKKNFLASFIYIYKYIHIYQMPVIYDTLKYLLWCAWVSMSEEWHSMFSGPSGALSKSRAFSTIFLLFDFCSSLKHSDGNMRNII